MCDTGRSWCDGCSQPRHRPRLMRPERIPPARATPVNIDLSYADSLPVVKQLLHQRWRTRNRRIRDAVTNIRVECPTDRGSSVILVADTNHRLKSKSKVRYERCNIF